MAKKKDPFLEPKRERKAKADRKPIPTARTDDERQKLYFDYKGKLAPVLSREALAKAELKKIYANAKAEGFHKYEFEYGRKFATPEGEADVAVKQEALKRVARWEGVSLGTQADMFADQDTRRDEHFEAGKRYNFENPSHPRKAPAHLNIEDGNRWYAGFDHASKINLETAANPSTGFRPLGSVAQGVADGVAH